jgi:hypothetical protein
MRDALQDTDSGGYRWADAELLRYLSEAQRAIVGLAPEANTIGYHHVISDAIPRRITPADSLELVTVECNSASDGTRGGSIRRINADVLDAIDPNWRITITAPAARPTNGFYDGYVFDPRTPNFFWLYPRAYNGQDCWIEYVQTPTQLAAISDSLTLLPHYHAAMIEWGMWRAIMKEGRYTRPASGGSYTAKSHFDTFAALLGLTNKEYRALERASGAVDKGP